MILTIHQPEFMVWIGLIDKISKADYYVIADSFQVKKNYYDNRNKIRTEKGWEWITIPIESHNHKSFRDVKVIHGNNWQEKLLEKIKENYSKAPYFNEIYPRIDQIINQKHTFIFDYNYELLCQLLSWFNVGTYHIAFTSSLKLESQNGSDKCLETYLSGQSGKDYLDLKKFDEANIDIMFHEFKHPEYKQQYEPFIPNLSALDYLMNRGIYYAEIVS